MNKTKLCKFCKTEIDAKAKVCPNCKRPQKSHGCLMVIAALIIVFGCAATIILSTIGGNKKIQKSVSGVSDESEYITLEEYNSIQTGMSYEEVKEIVGSPGTVSSQTESNNISIIIITWYGNGVAGSNANVTFTNNAVTSKAQVGLK